MKYLIQTAEIVTIIPNNNECFKEALLLRELAQIALDFGDVTEFYRLMNEADLLENNGFFAD